MKIPRSVIIVNAASGTSLVKYLPAYYAPMFKAVWGRKLTEAGVQVLDLPPDASDADRYHDAVSVSHEEMSVVKFFSGGDRKAEAAMADTFRNLFPDGLKAVITKLMMADVEGHRARAAVKAVVAHQSFLDLGLDAVTALKFQAAGYATARELPVDDVIRICEVGGLAAAEAIALIENIAPPATKTAEALMGASFTKE